MGADRDLLLARLQRELATAEARLEKARLVHERSDQRLREAHSREAEIEQLVRNQWVEVRKQRQRSGTLSQFYNSLADDQVEVLLRRIAEARVNKANDPSIEKRYYQTMFEALMRLASDNLDKTEKNV